MKKSLIIVSFVLTLALLATGCAAKPTPTTVPSATAKPSASPMASPMVSPSMSPEASMEPSMQPEASPSPSEGAAPSFDTEALRTEVEKLSEVKSAVIAAVENKALVGITFDPAYQGTLTDRIMEMVAQQVTGLEKSLTEVAVTADPEQVRAIEELSVAAMPDKLKFDELFSKLKPEGSNNTEK